MSKSPQHDRNRRIGRAIGETARGKGRQHPLAEITRAHQRYNASLPYDPKRATTPGWVGLSKFIRTRPDLK